MKTVLTAAAIAAFAFSAATPVLAQQNNDVQAKEPVQRIIEQPVDQQANTTTDQQTTGAIDRVMLESGQNSFTEGQAKDRIEGEGFTNVGTLTLDNQGIWRGTAKKGALTVNVGLDFKGNVASDKAE